MDSYGILYDDGMVYYHNVPGELEKELEARDMSFEFIGLGPYGQYFVYFGDGSIAIGGIDDKKRHALSHIEGKIRRIVFGGTNMCVAHDTPLSS